MTNHINLDQLSVSARSCFWGHSFGGWEAPLHIYKLKPFLANFSRITNLCFNEVIIDDHGENVTEIISTINQRQPRHDASSASNFLCGERSGKHSNKNFCQSLLISTGSCTGWLDAGKLIVQVLCWIFKKWYFRKSLYCPKSNFTRGKVL